MAAPSHFAGNASRYQVTSVLGRSQDGKEIIQDMEDILPSDFNPGKMTLFSIMVNSSPVPSERLLLFTDKVIGRLLEQQPTY